MSETPVAPAFAMRRRPLAVRLQYLAIRLRDGTEPEVVADLLDVEATELLAREAVAEANSPAALAEQAVRDRRHLVEAREFVRGKTVELAAADSPLVTTFAYDVALHDPGSPVFQLGIEIRWCDFTPSGPRPVEHDHEFSTVGRCMWPGCRATAE